MTMTRSKSGVTGDKGQRWLAEHGYLMSTMTDSECKAFTESLEPVVLRDGEVLFAEGDPDDRLFIIRHGEVVMGKSDHPHHLVNFGVYGSMDMDDADSKVYPICLQLTNLKEGDCAGEVGILDCAPHAMTARAKGNVQVYCLDAEHIKQLEAKNPLFCQCVDGALAKTQHKIALAA